MLRIQVSPSAAAAVAYFDSSLSKGDYYLEGQEAGGRWFGRIGERLGLQDEVQRDAFADLVNNRSPLTGERLTARQQDNRRAGYDLVFSAPKGVSVVFELTRDGRILEAFQESIRETMLDVEAASATRRRSGKDTTRETTGEIVWGEFVHYTSRPVDGVPDMGLHAHCYVVNATYSEQMGRYQALDLDDVKQRAPLYEAAFHSRFGKKLTELGYQLQFKGKWWDLAGVPPHVVNSFSRRRDQVLAIAADRGVTDETQIHELGRTNREAKERNLSMDELRGIWASRLSTEDLNAVKKAKSAKRMERSITPEQAVADALEVRFAKASVVEQWRVLELAIRSGVGSFLPEDVLRVYGERRDLIRGEVNGKMMVTTLDVAREEERLIAFARDGRGAVRPIKTEPHVFVNPKLNEDQRKAVQHVLTSTDRVVLIEGEAGTGKTTLSIEAVNAIKATGRPVMMLAPWGTAVDALRKAGFPSAETLANFLDKKELQKPLRAGVIWLDEAGLVGNEDALKLNAVVERLGARIVKAGDYRQHAPIDRGDSFRLEAKESGCTPVVVSQIVRQKTPELREAAKYFAQHRIADGLAKVDAMNCLLEVSENDRLERISREFFYAKEARRSFLCVSPTHAEGERITSYLRANLRDRKLLRGADRQLLRLNRVDIELPQKKEARWYEPGMVVQFSSPAPGFKRGDRVTIDGRDDQGRLLVDTRNGVRTLPLEHADRFEVFRQTLLPVAGGDVLRISRRGTSKDGHQLKTGLTYTVDGFTKNGDIRLTNGWVVGRDFGMIAHGYVSTSHSGQGKDADVVVVSESSATFSVASREQLYVSASRVVHKLLVLTDDKEGLKQAADRSSARTTATEAFGRTPGLQHRSVVMRAARMWHGVRERVAEAQLAIAARAARTRTQQRTYTKERGMDYGR